MSVPQNHLDAMQDAIDELQAGLDKKRGHAGGKDYRIVVLKVALEKLLLVTESTIEGSRPDWLDAVCDARDALESKEAPD